MTRLDQNRASFLLAQKSGVPITDVSRVIIWGNHSSTQVPDFFHARIKNRPVDTFIQDRGWLEHQFVDQVRNRGAEIIQARGKSSAASAAHALIEAVRDTLNPDGVNPIFSSGVISDGNGYGIEDQLIFSFPCHLSEKDEVLIVHDLQLNEFLASRIKASERELIEEREAVKALLT